MALCQHHGGGLTRQDGQRVSSDRNGSGYDEDYQVNGQKVNLEVERSSDGVRARLEYGPS